MLSTGQDHRELNDWNVHILTSRTNLISQEWSRVFLGEERNGEEMDECLQKHGWESARVGRIGQESL